MSKPLLKKTKPLAKPKPLKKAKEKPLAKRPEKHLVKKSATAAPAPPPKQLVKREVAPPPPRSGPKPTIPKGWKWLGKKDPAFKKEGLVLIDPGSMPDTFPSFHPRIVPGTQWRVDPKGKREPCLVTTLPDKVRVAWENCNTCTNHVTRCNCKGGIVHPRSVEWMHIVAIMRKDGEDISFPMDSTGPHVTMRGVLHYAGKAAPVAAPVRPRRTPDVSKSHPTPSKPATGRSGRLSKPVRKGKTLQKPRKPVEQVDVKSVDLVELGQQASVGADKLVADFTKRITSEKKKPLLKKGKR